ncbi:signal transduction histidine kinase [Clostridium zeae]|uniref:histidine kinase n=2 Tax=Clostridium zeae TaxID=2759022 RepID=A0ABQ1EGY7_9CLOT|nr:signal transduction histidine kinase [Clostridium zeae]
MLMIFLLIFNKGSNIIENSTTKIYIIALIIAMNSLVSVFSFYSILFRRGERGLVESMRNLEQLNRTLREQRHDYLNHIQIIYGLMELGEFEEAKNYMEPVYKDIIKLSKALKTSEPAINALLQAKLQMAEQKDIVVEIEVKTELKRLPIKAWEICRILGNLVDNSIYALQLKDNSRFLFIELTETVNNYKFTVMNNGPKISTDTLSSIFSEGFTTKGNEGNGMGLFIVKEILDSCNGEIKVESSSDRTVFYFTIPKIEE